jgi:hypothetical protein
MVELRGEEGYLAQGTIRQVGGYQDKSLDGWWVSWTTQLPGNGNKTWRTYPTREEAADVLASHVCSVWTGGVAQD